MNSRREFIKRTALGVTALSLTPSNLLSKPNLTQLTILHTNDMHSHIQSR